MAYDMSSCLIFRGIIFFCLGLLRGTTCFMSYFWLLLVGFTWAATTAQLQRVMRMVYEGEGRRGGTQIN
jgi:hypothetical protein